MLDPILIFGSTGQLGGELVTACEAAGRWKVHALSHGDLGWGCQYDID